MRVDVDEARRQHQPGGIDDVGRGIGGDPFGATIVVGIDVDDARDAAVAQRDIGDARGGARSVDHGGAADQRVIGEGGVRARCHGQSPSG